MNKLYNTLTKLLLLLPFVVAAQTEKKPNIIVFLVDDMGWQDTSVPFWREKTRLNKIFRTPNMERLAADGAKFTNAYANPVCTPTRVSMLSGMTAAHHHITNYTAPVAYRNTDVADEQFYTADWNINGMSPIPDVPRTCHATPFPKLLKDAGYFTIHVGKAHWGSAGTPGSSPYNMGFMVNISGHAAGHPQSYLGTENYGNNPGKATWQAVPDLEEYFGRDTFLTEALTLEAMKALEQPIKEGRPFYLNMAHYAVHTPLMADKRFYAKYIAAGLDEQEAKYASLIEGMDKSLGDLMNYLDEKNVSDNTIIIFMSDNGGLSISRQRGGEPHIQNLPLKAGKGSVYEGGIREPMLVKWPGVVKPRSIVHQYVVVEDFFPTILEMARVENVQTVQQIDGKSFVYLLKNPVLNDTSRVLIWHWPNKWTINDGPGINYKSAIRKGDWKLIYNMRDGLVELYNLKYDIQEMHDVARQNTKIVADLVTILSDKLRQWDAPMPKLKSTGQKIPWPDANFNFGIES